MGGITLYINHIPLSQFGGKLRANYTVSGSAVTADYYKPRDGNAFISLGSRIGLKTITLPFDLYGSSPRETKRNLSALDALCLSGKVELYLPDGFYYTSILQSIGVPQQITPSVLLLCLSGDSARQNGQSCFKRQPSGSGHAAKDGLYPFRFSVC